MTFRGPPGPLGALLESLVAPSRPSEALQAPSTPFRLQGDNWAPNGALVAPDRALGAPWWPAGVLGYLFGALVVLWGPKESPTPVSLVALSLYNFINFVSCISFLFFLLNESFIVMFD